jgi:hypothetical protein
MTGFIRGLFGGNKSDQPEQPKGAFFLDDDSAKSMGDVEYMRSIKATRRTFPVTVDQPDHIEIVQSVSAVDKSVQDSRKAGGYAAPKAASYQAPAASFSSGQASSFSSAPAASFSSGQASSFSSGQASSFSSGQPQAAEPTAEPTVDSSNRRKADSGSGMDMFRSMAKDIRK